MYFGHKHVVTGPNWLHKVATFLKYYLMPLRNTFSSWHLRFALDFMYTFLKLSNKLHD